jgi:NAD(P)-dependent dehydrogenase (short-subunit alcohol dehydrogenase family)
MISLIGKTALVTGAARGIGYEIASVLGRAGASVVIADLDGATVEAAANEIRKAGVNCLGVTLDVTNDRSVHEAVDRATAHFGGLDILVNNAGVFQKSLGLAVDDEDFSHCLDVNTVGVWRVVRAALPHLSKATAASIINIASNGGRQGVDFAPAYCASKAAVVSLTQSLALLVGPERIRVNAICPGRIDTELAATINQLKAEAGTQSPAQARQPALAGSLTATDIGNAVAFFASSLSQNITSQTLIVDRGFVIF